MTGLAARPLLNWGLALACVALPVLVNHHVGNYTESGYFTFESGLIDWMFVQKMGLSLLLLSLLKSSSARLHHRMSSLASTSFAIFFVHGYAVYAMRILFTRGHSVDALDRLLGPGALRSIVVWLSWLVATATVVMLSHCIALMVKQMAPRWSRYLVGY